MKVVFPGSFDPFTLGHLDLARRAAALFDQVVVAVGRNPAKDYLFDLERRLALARASCADLPQVTVEPLPGLVVDFCRDHQVSTIVKGARSGRDFDVELDQAQMNASAAGVETVLLPASPGWGFISASLVRQLAHGGADIRAYVPPAVFDYWERSGHGRP
ncbi:MAG: pantetheine-phosphate adenylyltransferase [Propionibacteriaceae bacterium]|jgi:pantetheine-phosphate adenylyltransferase|nr:pantetheine-phosphate adenylyltransferase [Propionibacteriaceae bacterium]